MNKEDVVYVYTPHTHTHAMECYLAIKKNEMMPFAATYMNLEIIILNEVKKRETNTV